MATEHLVFKSGLNVSGFVQGMNKMQASAAAGAKNITGAFSTVAGKVGAVGAAMGLTLSAAAFAQATRGVFNLADSMTALSLKTGIAVRDLLPMEEILRDSGVSAEAFGGAIGRMQKQIADGDGAFKGIIDNFDAFQKLGPAQQFVEIGKSIARMSDPTQRTANAMRVFGKSGGDLLELFDALRTMEPSSALTKQAEILERNSEIFGQIADKLDKAYIPLRGFFAGFAEGIAPHLLKVLDKWGEADMAEQGKAFAGWMKQASDSMLPVLTKMGEMYQKVNGWYGKSMAFADDINRSIYGPTPGNTPGLGKQRVISMPASASTSLLDFWRTPDTRNGGIFKTPDPRDKSLGFIGGGVNDGDPDKRSPWAKRGVDAQVADLQRRFGDKLGDDDFRNRFQPRTSSEQLQSWARRMGVKDKAYNQIRSRSRAEREAAKAAAGDSTVGLAKDSVNELKTAFKEANKELVNE